MATPDAVIRRGLASDAPALTRIFLAARRASMPYLPVLHTDAETAWWMQHVVLGRAQVLVAMEGTRPIGFAALDADRLDHLYVAPERQSRGIGRALLQAAQAQAAGLRLHVFERNRDARRFYERHGFKVIRRRDGSASEEGLPDLVMGWSSCPRADGGPGWAGVGKETPPDWPEQTE